MYRFLKIVQLNILIMVSIMVLLCGCGSVGKTDSNPKDIDTGFRITHAGTYDSADVHAVITSMDKEQQTITFLNRVTGRKYTLSYNGASKLYDKYGSALVIDQVHCGDVVDLTFLKGKKLINSLAKSSDAWVFDEQVGLDFDRDGKKVVIGNDVYRYDDKSLQVFANEKNTDFMDVNDWDVLSISGYDREIYSIVVKQSHGYLRLKGEESFVGGYIEVGKVIQKISDHMLLTVPVGNYDVLLSNGQYKSKSSVEIKSNEETQLDVSSFVTKDNTQYGKLLFVLSPSNAEVYIDGNKVNTSKYYEVEYGIHQLIVKATGYDTITQYIKVGQENATLDITLELETNPDLLGKNRVTPGVEATVTPDPNVKPVPTAVPMPTQKPVTPEVNPNDDIAVIISSDEEYKVKIKAPQDVEVYVDGNYVGIVPVAFAKIEGKHEITLRKEGYIPKTYTIQVGSSYHDEEYSFSELEKIN